MPRDLLEDRKRAPERLHAAALAILGVVVDGAALGCTSRATAALREWRASRQASAWFAISRTGSPRGRTELYQAVRGNE